MSLIALEANHHRELNKTVLRALSNAKHTIVKEYDSTPVCGTFYSSAFIGTSLIGALQYCPEYAKRRGSKRFIPRNEKNRANKQFHKVK